MPKLPDPPSCEVLQRLDPPIVIIPAGKGLARVYFASGDHPVSWSDFRYWGPAKGARMDHHLADDEGRSHEQTRGIMYCAELAITCIAEVFQASRAIDRTAGDPYLGVMRLERSLRVLDLTSEFATQMGASLAIHSGPRNRTRLWARALYDAFEYDALLYLSSMHPGGRALALNERAKDAIPATPVFNRPLADPSLTDEVDACAARLGYLKV